MIHETIKKNGITFGIITGLTSVLITTLIYSIDLNLFTSPWIGFTNLALYLIIAVILLVKTKKEFKDIFTFKDAFTTYFISALIGIIISVVFNIVLFNFVDPSAKETIKELTIKYMISAMEKFNAPAATINGAIKDLRENDQFSIIGLLKGSLSNIVFCTIFGLILAAFFKSKPSSQE
jgi:signal transduction histidine kinase